MTDQPDAPADRPVNPGDVAGGTYGRDKAEIARRSEAHKDKDSAGLHTEGGAEPRLDDEPEGKVG